MRPILEYSATRNVIVTVVIAICTLLIKASFEQGLPTSISNRTQYTDADNTVHTGTKL